MIGTEGFDSLAPYFAVTLPLIVAEVVPFVVEVRGGGRV
jgi:hypothetical protein